jgi:hypothetical protein
LLSSDDLLDLCDKECFINFDGTPVTAVFSCKCNDDKDLLATIAGLDDVSASVLDPSFSFFFFGEGGDIFKASKRSMKPAT